MNAERRETKNYRIKVELPESENILNEPSGIFYMWGLQGNHLRKKNQYKQRTGGKLASHLNGSLELVLYGRLQS